MGASGNDSAARVVRAVPTERDRQRDETRRRVRQVALDAIRRDGVADARIDEIAQAAGVSRGTVYFHYPTKEHVVGEVLSEAEARVAAALDALPKGAPLSRVLDVFCVAFAKEWEKEPQLFPSAAVVALQRAAAAIKTRVPNPVLRVLATRFRDAFDRGELTNAMRPGVLADVFLTNVLAATLAWCARPRPRPRLATVLGDTVEVFWNGARARKK
jgi:AcrR family transcriptional regulator